MTGDKYLLVSLPTSITKPAEYETALRHLKSTVHVDNGSVYEFPIPPLKIGTLDALVLQADELAKIDTNIDAAVAKAADVLKSVLGSEEQAERYKVVNDKPVDDYLKNFSWNKVKYRQDRSIAEILDSLQKEVISLDTDIKIKYNAYQAAKSNLLAVQRKQTGNLATRSLAQIVKKSDFVPPSEYIETLLIAVPKQLSKEWLKTYETLTPMIVPRSSQKLAEDSEYVLYSVTLFKKHSAEFVSKARAHKFVPREFKWSETAREDDEREVRTVEEQEKRVSQEILRLARTGYGDLVAAGVHVKALRVFVESVLRYGLPLEIVSAIIKTTQKQAKKARKQLDEAYSYLGGNAFGKDKNGKIKDDVPDVAVGLMGDQEYTAYCYFEFEVV
ncbi:Vacuolar ATP synthase subunit C [Rhizina undulata]